MYIHGEEALSFRWRAQNRCSFIFQLITISQTHRATVPMMIRWTNITRVSGAVSHSWLLLNGESNRARYCLLNRRAMMMMKGGSKNMPTEIGLACTLSSTVVGCMLLSSQRVSGVMDLNGPRCARGLIKTPSPYALYLSGAAALFQHVLVRVLA